MGNFGSRPNTGGNWEEQLERWRKGKRSFLIAERKNNEINETLDGIIDKLGKIQKKIDKETDETFDRTLFASRQLKKMKPLLKDILKNTPINRKKNTKIESLTDVSLYTKSYPGRGWAPKDMIIFEFGEFKVELEIDEVFDVLLYTKNANIMRKIIPFVPPTLEFVKTVEANDGAVPGGSCDVCGHEFNLSNLDPKYFPLISSVGNDYWCCQLCQNFLRRYLKEDGKSDLIENIATESDLMNIQPALKF